MSSNCYYCGGYSWEPAAEYPDDNSVVLTANPDEGTLPVIAWKVEDTWYHHDLRQTKPLDPQPTIWLRWPKMPRALAIPRPSSNSEAK